MKADGRGFNSRQLHHPQKQRPPSTYTWWPFSLVNQSLTEQQRTGVNIDSQAVTREHNGEQSDVFDLDRGTGQGDEEHDGYCSPFSLYRPPLDAERRSWGTSP